MMKLRKQVRDVIAFWIFGLANNFAYVIMLSAAEDIIHKQSGDDDDATGHHNSSASHCLPELGKPRCTHLMSTGAVLLADILPALCLKFTCPFFINRIPFGFRHCLVCSLQAISYLIVAFSSSIQMSLVGVVFASASSGLGEICYLALSSHYKKTSIAAWSSGTGGAGLIGALAYALLTQPELFGLSPTNALLCMLIVPAIFAVTYWCVLTPSPSVHRACLCDVSTWLVPVGKQQQANTSTASASSSTASSPVAPITLHRRSLSDDDSGQQMTGGSSTEKRDTVVATDVDDRRNANARTQIDDDGRMAAATETLAAPAPVPFTHEFPFAFKLRLVLPLLRFMVPLSTVYFAEYLINSGLHQLIHFDCAHGFALSNESQFRWYQALYQFGVFTSRSSVSWVELPPLGLYILPFLQCANVVIFYLQALHHVLPHIAIVFTLIYIEGLFGGASYVNTFNRIHKEAPPEVREFSLSIASAGDSVGISLSGFCSILLHNHICALYPRVFP